MNNNLNITVAIPCHNEAATIGKVIDDFRRELPSADIVVVDNNSTDGTADVCRERKVRLIQEQRKGKGWAVQAVFQHVKTDIVVIVDGDDTYPAEEIHKLIEPVSGHMCDMAVGTRLEKSTRKTLKSLHRIGNIMITNLLNCLFGTRLKDVLSGYRVINANMIKNLPLLTRGFEIEVELTLQALEHGYRIYEVPIVYRERKKGSKSKLNTFKDGYEILIVIAMLLRDHQPIRLFSFLGALSIIMSVFIALNAKSGSSYMLQVIFSGIAFFTGIMLFVTGLILSAVGTRFKEIISLIKRNMV